MKFSPSQKTFVDPRLADRYIAAGSWPDDARDISVEDYAAFSGVPPAGKRLGADEDGNPAWIDAPRFTDAAEAERAIVAHIDAATREVTGRVPDDEKTSWPVKAAAAVAYGDGTASAMQVAMIEAEAAASGESPGDLADLIVSRTERNAAIIAPLAGIRRKAVADMAAAASPADMQAIVNSAVAAVDAAVAAALAVHED